MIDWEKVGQEAAQLLAGYLRIQTANPPGNEEEAAFYLKEFLEKHGFQVKLFESAPHRANLVARLKGDGSKRPILLYNHMDVVEADATRWSCDPFGGEIRDGYVWGRGAIDMKSMGIMQLLALVLLAQEQPKRTRDIIFLAGADEEKGSQFGAKWMVEHHWQEIDAEYAWDEGGFGMSDLFGPQPVFTVAVAEKKDLWLKLIAHGEPGYSGIPQRETSINTLLHALERVQMLNSAYELHGVTREMFKRVSQRFSFPKNIILRNLDKKLCFKMALPGLSQSPKVDAMLRDTLSVTVLKAGGKENIIPEKAEAILDMRLLPGKSPQQAIDRLHNLIGDERVEIEVIEAPEPSVTSDMHSEFFEVLSSVLKRNVPEGLCTPLLTPGTTDSAFFRQKGVQSYGLIPIILDPGEMDRYHGIDERISIRNLELGTRVIFEVMRELIA